MTDKSETAQRLKELPAATGLPPGAINTFKQIVSPIKMLEQELSLCFYRPTASLLGCLLNTNQQSCLALRH